jgi:hypothetical protein
MSEENNTLMDFDKPFTLPIVENYVPNLAKSDFIIGGYPKPTSIIIEPDAEDDLRKSTIHFPAKI